MRRGAILWMSIVNHQQLIEPHLIHGQQVATCFLKGSKGAEVVEIADVLTHECLPIHHESDSILEIGAQGQDWLLRGESDHCGRSIAAAAAKDGRTKGTGTYDRIIDATRNWTFPHKECVRDFGQAP